jgi:tetratricopeptide (TPR) repeat protein
MTNIVEQIQRAAEILNSGRYLLVLDNLEVLSDEAKSQLMMFLDRIDRTSGTFTILTLRPEAMPPLVDPTKHNYLALPIDSLPESDAVKLMAVLTKPRAFSRAQLKQIAVAAHRHPLLLHMAAADLKRSGSMFADVIRRLRELQGADLRRTVDAGIGQMLQTVTEDNPSSGDVLRAMLAFSGGARRVDLHSVLQSGDDTGPWDLERFEDACRACLGSSLLESTGDGFDLHPLVRQFLELRRASTGRKDTAFQKAHSEVFLLFARTNQRAYKTLESERLNIFGGFKRAVTAQWHDQLIGYADALFSFFLVRGLWTEGRALLLHAVKAAEALASDTDRRKLQHRYATLCRYQGDLQEAADINDAIARWPDLEHHPELQAAVCREQGIIARHRGRHDEALRHYEKGLEVGRKAADPEIVGWLPHEKGVMLSFLDRDHEAQQCFEVSLLIAESTGDRALKANTLLHLGISCWKEGKLDDAAGFCRQGLVFAKDIGDRAVEGRITNQLGVIHSHQEHFDEAEKLFRQSVVIKRQLGDKTGLVVSHYFVAEMELRKGRLEDAQRRFFDNLGMESINSHWLARNFDGLACCAEARDMPEWAEAFASVATRLARRLGMERLIEDGTALRKLVKARAAGSPARHTDRDVVAALVLNRRDVRGRQSQDTAPSLAFYDEGGRKGLRCMVEGSCLPAPYLDDKSLDPRRGLTLIVRPSVEIVQLIGSVLERLRAVDPRQYYYRGSSLHYSILSLIDGTDDLPRDDPEFKRYRMAIEPVLRTWPPFEVEFDGIFATEDAIVAKGFFKSGTLDKLREALRAVLRRMNLADAMERRYTLQGAHMTVARFRDVRDLRMLAVQVEALREYRFGAMAVAETRLVINDFYMTDEMVKEIATIRLSGAAAR